MKSNILPILTIFAIPLLYFYNESIALLLTSIATSGYVVFTFWEQKKERLLPTKLFTLIVLLVSAWLFTVGRSVLVSCSFYNSYPVFFKICTLLLITYSVCYQITAIPGSYLSFYRIAALTGFLQGLMAICEYIEAPPIPKTWLDPESKELFRTRCCGIMTDPNIFAAFMSVLFIFTVALIIHSDSKKEKIWAGISLLLCGTGIIMTLSRGGWVALIAALIFYCISIFISKKKPDKSSIKILLISSILLLIIFFTGPFKYRLFSITKPSDMTFFQRTLINRGIFAAIKKFPIYGHGLHTFALVYPVYRIVGGDYPLYTHNEYLQSMIETGFLSSIILAVITLFLIKISFIAAKQKNYTTLAFSSAFISLLIQNLSGFSARIFPTSVLIAIAVGGILSSQLKKAKVSQNISSRSPINYINYGILILVIAVIPSNIKVFDIQNQLNKANIVLNAGNTSEAIKIFENVLLKEPNQPIAANSLGMLYLLHKQNDKAADIWKNAMNSNKYEANFPINLARLYSHSNPEQTDFYYKKAIELDPASELFRLEYADFLIKQNKKNEAKEIIKKGLSYSPGFHNVYTGFKEMEELLPKL